MLERYAQHSNDGSRIMRFAHCRADRRAAYAGADQLIDVVDRHASDRQMRHIGIVLHELAEISRPGGHAIRFERTGEHRAYAAVICALAYCCISLSEVMSAHAHQQSTTRNGAH